MAKLPRSRPKARPRKAKAKKRKPEHDSSYKLLFSHPAMVADLLNGFVAEDWVKDLGFTTLEK